MALLNFKMGLRNSLYDTSKAPITAGTVYVTTDERAMYVDIDENTRIRLGDFRIYENLDALKNDVQNWSQYALVYCEDENALARFDGTKWTLINDTAKLSEAISKLQDAAVVVNDKLDGIPQIKDAEGKDTNKGAVKAYIDAADEAIGTRIGAVENRAKALEDAVGKEAEGENAATGLFLEIDTVAQKVAALEGFVSGGDQGSLEAAIDTRVDAKIQALDSEKSSAAVETGKGLQVTVKQVDGKINEVLLTGNFDEKYDAKGAANTVSQNLTQAIGELDTAYKAADLLINAKLEGIDTTVVAAIDAAKTAAVNSANSHADGLVNDLKGGSEKTIKQLAEEIAGNDSDIAALQTAVGTTGLGGRVSALEGKVDVEKVSTAIATAKSGAETTAKGYADTAEANAKAAVKALEDGQVATNKLAIEALQGAVGDTGLGKRVSDLETKVDVEEATVKAAIVAAEGRAATDAQTKANAAEAAAKEAVTNLANGQVASNANAIQTLQTAIGKDGAVEKTIDSKITAKIESLDVTKASEGHEITVTVTQTDGLISNVAVAGNFDKKYDASGSAAAVQGELNTAKQNLTDAINGVSGKVDTEKGRIDTILKDSTVKTFKEVEGLIASSIAANDAMVFKGVVTSTSGLPASGMENGDTYKVAETGAYTVKADGTTEDAKIGDLFIYDGIAGEWRLIPSGGEDYKDPVLSAADNKIVLTSGVTNQQVGTVEIVGANDSLTISTENNKITLALEWGTF